MRAAPLLVLLVGCGAAPQGHPPAEAAGAFASWPMPNPAATALPNPARLKAGDAVVTDERTGLRWERAHADKTTWAEARARCEGLVLAGAADWRLPTRIELVSIVDFTRLPAIDGNAFPDTAGDYFWSASRLARDARFAWTVYFGHGVATFGAAEQAGAHVRCVRGPAAAAAPRYDVRDQTVLDRGTGLRWQRHPPSAPLPAALAEAYCRELRLDGAAGYRLPSVNELSTLVDERRTAPALDTDAFPPDPMRLWSSTESNVPDVTDRRVVDFVDGEVFDAAPGEMHGTRCVR